MPKDNNPKPDLKETEKKAKELVSDLEKEGNFFLQKIPATPYWRVFLTLIFLLILFITTVLLAVLTEKIQASEPTNYEECIRLESSKILESYPAVCVTKTGTRFTQQVPENQPEPTKTPKNELDTSTWKIYNNANCNYNIKHPNDWKVNNLNDLIGNLIYLTSPDFQGSLGIPGTQVTKGVIVGINCEEEPYEYTNAKLKENCLRDYSESNLCGTSQFGTIEVINVPTVGFYKGFVNGILYNFEVPIETEETIKILSTFELLDANVQGATSSAFENPKTFEEVSECKDLSETERLLYQQEYEDCFAACTEELEENECNQICKPVCDEVAKPGQ